MVQESPTEPDPSESEADGGTDAEVSSDPIADRMEAEEREDASGVDGESSVEEAVDEAVAEVGESETSTSGESDTSGPGTAGGSGTSVTVETEPQEQAALRRVKTLSKLLDDAVRIPGTNARVGIDPILGIVPGAGDAVAAALSLYPVAEAYRLDAPPKLIAKMLSLIAVDLVVGSVPLLGPLFDAFWKANEWNARSLERHLQNV